MSKLIFRLMIVASSVALLTSCSSGKSNNCPGVTSLVETSVGTVFRPGASADPSNILYTVEITDVKSSCDVDKSAESSSSDLDINFRATRAPNGAGAAYHVPYFVAISQGDRILAKKEFTADFAFEPGQMTTTFTDSVNSASVTAGRDKKTFDYLILVGLQLTRAQLQYNRTSGRLAP